MVELDHLLSTSLRRSQNSRTQGESEFGLTGDSIAGILSSVNEGTVTLARAIVRVTATAIRLTFVYRLLETTSLASRVDVA